MSLMFTALPSASAFDGWRGGEVSKVVTLAVYPSRPRRDPNRSSKKNNRATPNVTKTTLPTKPSARAKPEKSLKQKWVEDGRSPTVKVTQNGFEVNVSGLVPKSIAAKVYASLRSRSDGAAVNAMLHTYLTGGVVELHKQFPSVSLNQVTLVHVLAKNLKLMPKVHDLQHIFATSKDAPYGIDQVGEAAGATLILLPMFKPRSGHPYLEQGIVLTVPKNSEPTLTLSPSSKVEIRKEFEAIYNAEINFAASKGGDGTSSFFNSYIDFCKNGVYAAVKIACSSPSLENHTESAIRKQATEFVFGLRATGVLTSRSSLTIVERLKLVYIRFANDRLNSLRAGSNHQEATDRFTISLANVLGGIEQRKFAATPKAALYGQYIDGIALTVSLKALFPSKFVALNELALKNTFDKEWRNQSVEQLGVNSRPDAVAQILKAKEKFREQLLR